MRRAHIALDNDGWNVICFDKSGNPVPNVRGRMCSVYRTLQVALAVANLWLDYGTDIDHPRV